MKKLFFILALCCASVAMYADDCELTKGSVAALKEKGELALLEVDYSKAKVKDQTLDEYLKGRGEDFVKDWPEDSKKAAAYFTTRFNRENKKGMTIPLDGEGAKYKIVLSLTDMDMGNASGAFTPFASAKAGGVIVSGSFTLIDLATNEELCVIEFKEVKGVRHMSETVRLGLAYMELAEKVGDVIDDND